MHKHVWPAASALCPLSHVVCDIYFIIDEEKNARKLKRERRKVSVVEQTEKQ